MEAENEYLAALADLEEFCAKETNFNVCVITDCYPMQVHFTPAAVQQSLFADDAEAEAINCDSDGEISGIVITCALAPVIRSNLKFRIDTKLLTKLIKKACKLGDLYLRAFRECAELRFKQAAEAATRESIDELWTTSCPGNVKLVIFNDDAFKQRLEAAHSRLLSIGIKH